MPHQWDQNSKEEDCVPFFSTLSIASPSLLDSHGTLAQVLCCESDLPQLQFSYPHSFLFILFHLFFFFPSNHVIFIAYILIAWKCQAVLVQSNHRGDIYHNRYTVNQFSSHQKELLFPSVTLCSENKATDLAKENKTAFPTLR